MLKCYEQRLRNQFAASCPGVPFFFLLWPVPDESRLVLLEKHMSCMSGRFGLVAWRNPERNLDIPAVTLMRLCMSALGQRQNLTCFLSGGGIEGMMMRVGRRVLERKTVLFGAATLALCR